MDSHSLSRSPTARTAASTVTQDDAAVVEASLVDPERFGELFERHHVVVFRYVRSRIGTSADDVVGDTFIEAFRTRERFDRSESRSCLPWLLGIATNMLSRRRDLELRWLRRDPRAVDAARDENDDAEERVACELLTPRLTTALADIRDPDREVLLLHVAGDLTMEEVAKALSVPLGTVKSRLHRARRELASALEAHR